jgi:uncharacterized protein
MTTIRALIERYPVLIYYALVFSLSWGAVIAVLGGVPGPETESEELLPMAILAMLVGPAVAGPFMKGFVHGRKGLRELVSRLLTWRLGARWYAIALLTGPVSVLVSLFVLSLFSPEFAPGIVTTDDRTSLLLFGIMGGLVTGIFEELGWTGFATPELRRRYSLFAGGFSLGVVWGGWHFLVNFWGSDAASGPIPIALFLLVVLFAFLPPLRVLMVWVYDRTESLFVVTLMHASFLAFWLIFTPLEIAGGPLVTWYLVWGAVLWAVVVVVYVVNGRQFERRPP